MDTLQNGNDVLQALRVLDPGPLRVNYPHAGVLNTPSFLFRYPTTATNRNRARARWTYYHFLDVDIESSASRTMDPVALADTNNPTMHNPSCTVCHTIMDPVAGAFQDYGDDGFYRNQWGEWILFMSSTRTTLGLKLCRGRLLAGSGESDLAARLSAGTQTIKVTFTNRFWDVAAQEGGAMYLDRLDVLDDQERRVTSVEFEDVDVPVAPWGGLRDTEAQHRHRKRGLP